MEQRKPNMYRRTDCICFGKYRLDGPTTYWFDGSFRWRTDGSAHRIDGMQFYDTENFHPTQYAVGGEYTTRYHQEDALHNETIKLGEITQFIDFVARCDIILL